MKWLDGDQKVEEQESITFLSSTGNTIFSMSYDETDDRFEITDVVNDTTTYINRNQSGDLLVTGAPHSDLSGLGADDHTQYLLVDGSRAMSGNLDMGDNTISNLFRATSNQMPLNESMLTGLLSGGVLSKGTNARELDVESGVGFIKNNNELSVKINWNAQTITVPTNAEKNVYIDDTGTLSLADFGTLDLDKVVILGSTVTDGDSIVFLGEHRTEVRDNSEKRHQYAQDVVGPVGIDGVLASQGGASGLSMDVTGGSYYVADFEASVNAETDVTFNYWYQDGSGGWKQQEGKTEINTEKYDDGSGTLADIPVDEWKKDVLYVSENGNDNAEYHVFYAQSTQSTRDKAKDSDLPIANQVVRENGLRSTGVVVQDGATSISDFTDERPFLGQLGPQTTSVDDHGNLTGLSDDDHTQYLHTDGRRAMTGALDLGSNDINNVGTANTTRLNSTDQPLTESLRKGWLSGGEITETGALEITVAAGSGFVEDAGEVIPVNWSETVVSLSADVNLSVYVDSNGDVQTSSTDPDFTGNIILGDVQTDSDSIIFLSEHNIQLGDKNERDNIYARDAIGPIAVSGVLASQGSATALSLDVSSGTFYILDERKEVTANNDITFNYWYRDGSGGWNVDENQTEIDTSNYDDGSGTLATITSNNDWKKDTVFVAPTSEGPEYHVVYGQQVFNSQEAAEDGAVPNVFDDLTRFALQSTGVVVQESGTSIGSTTDERPFVGQLRSGTTGVNDHANLSGLGDDDHTQYIHKDGRRAMTGDFDLGGNTLETGSDTVINSSGVVERENSVFGQDYTNAHSETAQSTSGGSSTFSDYLTMTTPTPSGTNDYRIEWNVAFFEGNQDGVEFRLRNKTDGTTVGVNKGATGTTGNEQGVNIVHTYSGSKVLSLSASKDFAIQYAVKADNTTTHEIREGDIEYHRVS